MINDFETVKKQLLELAEVVNKFKSEAVQLRIVELVLGGRVPDVKASEADSDVAPEERKPARAKTRKRARPKKKADDSVETPSGNTAPASRTKRATKGPMVILGELADQGFFSTPRAIGAIISHCDEKLVLKYKSSDLSPALGRLVKNNTLERSKNSDGQYEYTKRK